jgi:hypothetical protein
VGGKFKEPGRGPGLFGYYSGGLHDGSVVDPSVVPES